MRAGLVTMVGLGLMLAHAVGRQWLQTEEGKVATPIGGAQSGERSASLQVPLQSLRIGPAGLARGHSGTLPAARNTDADSDPLAELADVEPSAAAADVGPLLDADDELMAWALEPAEAPVESAPLLDAEDDALLAIESDDQPPIEVGPPMDADDPEAEDTAADPGVPIEVGPILNADADGDPGEPPAR
jgi:hypothetical protein